SCSEGEDAAGGSYGPSVGCDGPSVGGGVAVGGPSAGASAGASAAGNRRVESAGAWGTGSGSPPGVARFLSSVIVAPDLALIDPTTDSVCPPPVGRLGTAFQEGARQSRLKTCRRAVAGATRTTPPWYGDGI